MGKVRNTPSRSPHHIRHGPWLSLGRPSQNLCLEEQRTVASRPRQELTRFFNNLHKCAARFRRYKGSG